MARRQEKPRTTELRGGGNQRLDLGRRLADGMTKEGDRGGIAGDAPAVLDHGRTTELDRILQLAGARMTVDAQADLVAGCEIVGAGFALGRKDLLARMTRYNAGAMPVTAMAAAHAMLQEPDLVPARKRRNAERRNDLMRFFDESSRRRR